MGMGTNTSALTGSRQQPQTSSCTTCTPAVPTPDTRRKPAKPNIVVHNYSILLRANKAKQIPKAQKDLYGACLVGLHDTGLSRPAF